MIKLPGQVGFKQSNRSDTQGSLWSTFNIDLQTNMGSLRVNPRFKTNFATNGTPVAFQRFSQRIFALAGTTIYRNTDSSGLPNDVFAADSSTSNSTDYSSDFSDLLMSPWGTLLSTAPAALRSLSAATGGTWTDRAVLSGTNLNHKLCYFKKFDRVYFSDGIIKSTNSAFTIAASGDYTLSSDNSVGIVDMKATTDYIWIATESFKNLDGEVWQWDGLSNQITNAYKLPGARVCVALIIDKTRNIPMAMSDKGILYELSAGGFVEVGRLPYGTMLPYMGGSVNTNDRFIHPNGMTFTKNSTIKVLINGRNEDNGPTWNENLASGIWEWSKDTGFVHCGSLSYDPISSSITDFGQNQINRAGALVDMNIPDTSSGRDGSLMAGATIYTDATTTSPRIFFGNSIDTVQKVGYFVSAKMTSPNVRDQWKKLYVKYKKFLDSSDKIVVKCRTSDPVFTNISITWASTTTFTTTTNLGAYVNYEVEILRGTGSGICAHIVSVSGSGTYTVTIDETATGVTSGTATARVQNWTKLASITGQVKDFTKISVDRPSNWIQFKVWMLFKGADELNELLLTSNSPSMDVQMGS